HLSELITRAAGATPDAPKSWPGLLPDELFRRYTSTSLRGQLQMKLKKFQQFWNAEAIEAGPERFLYRFALPASFHSRYPIGSPGFEVEVGLFLPQSMKGTLTEAEARLKALG